MRRSSRRSTAGRLSEIRDRITQTVGNLTGRTPQKGTSKSGHIRVPRRGEKGHGQTAKRRGQSAKGRGQTAKGRSKRVAR
jgi:hypothetical protein